jgi:hypothetical protein
MWKPALFLLTVVLVTPDGRTVLGQYTDRAYSLFAVDPTYGDLTIVAMALVLLGLFLLVLCQSPKDPNAMWIVQRVQGPEPANASPHRGR